MIIDLDHLSRYVNDKYVAVRRTFAGRLYGQRRKSKFDRGGLNKLRVKKSQQKDAGLIKLCCATSHENFASDQYLDFFTYCLTTRTVFLIIWLGRPKWIKTFQRDKGFHITCKIYFVPVNLTSIIFCLTI